MKRILATTIVFCFAGFSLLAQEMPDPKQNEKKEVKGEDLPKLGSPEDIAKAIERINKNSKSAGKNLGERDPGEDTRKLQEAVLKDLDALIQKAQEPPPPSDMNQGGGNSNDKSNSGKSSGMSKNSSSNLSGGGRPPRERQKETPSGGMGSMNEPMMKTGMPDKGKEAGMEPKETKESGSKEKEKEKGGQSASGMAPKSDPKAPNPAVNEMYREIWGHLPERLRQEMDLYYRQQFMPRYNDLLRRYYQSLAEQRKRP